MESPVWKIVTDSVIGDSHTRKNIPNQDSIGYYQFPGNSPACILAVSDGHGSDRCPRSDIGSTLAVNAAIKVFLELWEAFQTRFQENDGFRENPTIVNSIERQIRRDLPNQLVNEWKKSVEKHIARKPLENVVDAQHRLLAYGATLTVAFVSSYFATCIRLGDCEVLVVDENDRVERMPSRENSNIGEDTDSLCMPDLEKRWQVMFKNYADNPSSQPKLIMVCSDGYEKAFELDSGFEKSAVDFAELLSTDMGRIEIERSLSGWLSDSSRYSGDDVSVGLIFNSSRTSASPADPSETLTESASLPAQTAEEIATKSDSISQPNEGAEKTKGDPHCVSQPAVGTEADGTESPPTVIAKICDATGLSKLTKPKKGKK